MVERADVNSVLSDIRALRDRMQEQQQVPQPLEKQIERVNEPGESDGTRFMDTLKGAVDQVNELQQTSGDLKTRYQKDDPEVDITRVMVANQKASVAFDATVEVRNRVVQAYETIMNMPI